MHRHRRFILSQGEIQNRRCTGRELRIQPIFGFKKMLTGSFGPVVSLLGVVLIARPPFIFNPGDKDSSTVIGDGATTEHRMAAVWCVIASSFLYFRLKPVIGFLWLGFWGLPAHVSLAHYP